MSFRRSFGGVSDAFQSVQGTSWGFRAVPGDFRDLHRLSSKLQNEFQGNFRGVLGGFRYSHECFRRLLVVSRRFKGISDALKMPLMLGIQKGLERLPRFTVGVQVEFQRVSGDRLV